MSTLAISALALATFLAGLFLGRRTARLRHAHELRRQTSRLQEVIDFADSYIEHTAPQRALVVLRDNDGHIAQLVGRCGTPFFAFKDLMEDRLRRKALH